MHPVVIRVPRWHQIVPLIGCLVILAVSLFVLAERGPSSLTWSVITAFGIGAIVCIGMLLEDSKRLVIDDDGIWSSTWRIGVVRWIDLKEVFVRSEGGDTFLCFSLHDRDEFRQRLDFSGQLFTDANRATGYGDLTVNATRFRLHAEEVLEFASKRIADGKGTMPDQPRQTSGPPVLMSDRNQSAKRLK